MRIVLGFLLFAFGLALVPASAEAALMFGKDETIHKIEDIAFQNREGEDLFLGYKTTIQFFVAGLYLTDDGYVLGVRGEDTFYPMPTGEELKGLQADGLLPDPLPAYRIGWFDYALGYSLWIILVGVAAFYGFGWLRKRARPPAAGPAGG